MPPAVPGLTMANTLQSVSSVASSPYEVRLVHLFPHVDVIQLDLLIIITVVHVYNYCQSS